MYSSCALAAEPEEDWERLGTVAVVAVLAVVAVVTAAVAVVVGIRVGEDCDYRTRTGTSRSRRSRTR